MTQDTTTYRKIEGDFVTLSSFQNEEILLVKPEALEILSTEAFMDINHYLRKNHLAQLRKILDDPEASNNDKFVALDLLKNANIAAAGILPMCQDTGTVIINAKKGRLVFVMGDDYASLAKGAKEAYRKKKPALFTAFAIIHV